jgi:hypothetical protein
MAANVLNPARSKPISIPPAPLKSEMTMGRIVDLLVMFSWHKVLPTERSCRTSTLYLFNIGRNAVVAEVVTAHMHQV